MDNFKPGDMAALFLLLALSINASPLLDLSGEINALDQRVRHMECSANPNHCTVITGTRIRRPDLARTAREFAELDGRVASLECKAKYGYDAGCARLDPIAAPPPTLCELETMVGRLRLRVEELERVE